MKKELQSIIHNMKSTLEGEPWFGRSVYAILDEINPSITFKKPNKNSHSLIDLLYHMNTWAEFTLKRIEGDKETDLKASEELDWRKIDPKIHSWEKGLTEFKAIHSKIIKLLNDKDDEFLKGIVDYRNYKYRFLIHGLIQHNIYHLGQIAYIKKLLMG
jgi:uncharacterized damage-inducible protein DinB